MANESDRRERDMILAPNEYAFISDETKGEVNVFVGPNKQSLAGTDRCVTFDLKSKRFRSTDLASGTQTFMTAPEGWYIVLKNPAENDKVPSGNGKLSTPNLRVGKKVNISGPASFALWPGQMAKVVQGHSLRSNEYLLVRVYDEEAARANWSKAVIKTQTTDAEGNAISTSSDIPSEKELSMGKQFIIRGTEVSFYIPPTGVEVVTEKVNGEERYVREAVSLERLEYCLLLDQNGNKRYVRGPDVVFPRPTEKFVEAPIKSNPDKVKAKKFRAQELTPKSGLHIRVITDYVEADGTKRKAGDELFVTGNEQPVYFPREEHAIIKYGEQDVHYGIAIPEGEARYVLDRLSGVISIVKGPQIFLPDPRTQVIAQRALPMKLCELLYPGNAEALEVNAARLGVEDQDFMGAAGANAAFLNSSYNGEMENYGAVAAVATPDAGRRVLIKAASKSLPGEAFNRKDKFTAPRSVILNTKYDGAVQTTIWTGYAMLLVRKNGERRVVQGPGTFMLEYDESPQVLTLSTGKPKNMDNPLRTVFLKTTANMVSDIVEVETLDFVKLNVKLSYRVNFEGDSNLWFNVDNYVKFLTDHMRSRIRNAVKKLGVEEFYNRSTDVIRDVVLGKASPDSTPRAGTLFEENGMRIYDVEVLGTQMLNPDVEILLMEAQRNVIQNTIFLAGERRKLSYIQESEELKRLAEETKTETQRRTMELQVENTKRKLELDLAVIEANSKSESERIAQELAATRARGEIKALALAERTAAREAEIALDEKAQALKLKELEAHVQAVVDKAKAVSPDLIAALSTFGERAMVEKVAQSMAPLSILGGDSAVDVLKKLLAGTTLAKQLEPVTNGSNKSSTSSRSA
jgi:major vault protein